MAIPIDLPYWLDFSFHPVTFILAAIVTVTAALMAGLVPAVRSSRQTLAEALREESRATTAGARAGRLRKGFAIGQFAMSFALLTSALLLALSFFRLQRFDHGFDARRVLTMRISLRGDAYEERAQRLRFVREILGNAQGLPGVTQAAVANDLPLRGNRDSGVRIVSEDRSVTPGEEEESQWRSVSPGYLDVFRIPLLRGRRFTETEDQVGAHVILISDSLARRLWPNGDALGRRLRNAASPGNWWEVIGITGTVRRAYRMGGIGHAAADRQIYAPLSSHSGASYRLAFRSADDLDGVSIATVKSALPRADSTIPLYDVASMETVVREAEWLPLLWIRLFSAFSLMALVLTSLGTYGIVSQSLQQRTQEMGVRLALGAEARQLSRLILHQAVTLAGLGIAFGLLVTVGMAPFLRVLLQGVDAFHPLVIAAAASVMAVMSLVAAGIPAWRAGRIDPIVALRCE